MKQMIATLAIAGGLGIAAAVSAGPVVVQHTNGIAHVSGGVGDAEQAALKAAASQFNLHVTLATKDGHYMGKTRLRLLTDTGRELLAVETQGPLFYADLDAGTYTVHATAEGQTRTETVTVPKQGTASLTMRWPNTML